MMSERILIVAPSWVGDAILSEPLVALLRERFGNPVIDVLAPPWCGPVYARMRGIGRVIPNPIGHGSLALAARRTLARSLRKADRPARYTCAFVLPNSWKSALVPWLAGIPRRIGYLGEARWGLLNDARRLHGKGPPRLVDRFAALAAPRSAPAPFAPPPVLVPDAANRAAAAQALGLGSDRPVAVLCPGAEYGPAKRWPTEYFSALAQRLAADGWQVWIAGSPKDAALGEEIARSGAGVNLCGKTSLAEAIDLMSCAGCVVSNDSGLMHVAAALDRPLTALYGSSSPAFTPPLSARARIVRTGIACSPCFERACPLGHFNCMMQLTPDQVMQHIPIKSGE